MKIRFKSNGVFLPSCCLICGWSFEPAAAIAMAFNDDNDVDDLGIVCRECIAAGPDGMKRRAREAVDRYHIQDEAIRFADELEKDVIDVPSLAAFELAIDRAYVERCGCTREQLEAVQGPETGCPF